MKTKTNKCELVHRENDPRAPQPQLRQFMRRRPSPISALLLALVAGLCVLFSTSLRAADGNPPGCSSDIQISLKGSLSLAHVGDTIVYDVFIINGHAAPPISGCLVTGLVASVTTPDGVLHPIALTNRTIVGSPPDFHSYPAVQSYVIRAQDIKPNGRVEAEAKVDGLVFVDSEAPLDGGAFQPDSTTVVQPCIRVTANCTPGVGQNGVITVCGSVTNCGNGTLTNVVVTLSDGVNTVVTNMGTLTYSLTAGGQSKPFCVNFVPRDPCVATSISLTATGKDTVSTSTASGPQSVSSVTSVVCQNSLTSGIRVTKSCPTSPIVPGGPVQFSGTVSNTGNVTLNNVFVVNNQPVANTPVLGPITLAPGQVVGFTGTYTAPQACSVTDTVTGSGTTICGQPVIDSATATCQITTTPSLTVSLACQTAPIGATATFNGTVQNNGNVTLNNVTVSVAGDGVIALGNLAPGASSPFSGVVPVPANSCSVSSVATATGFSVCNPNVPVSATSQTATCNISATPCLTITSACVGVPQPGQSLTYSGVVSNCGTILMTNVIVINDKSGQILGPISLAPGATATYTGSFLVDAATGCTTTNTSTVIGTSTCGGQTSASATTSCPILNLPGMSITLRCPTQAVAPGGLIPYTVSVCNTGTVGIVNLTVVINGLILGQNITLPVNACTNFTANLNAPADECSARQTAFATGTGLCGGPPVTASTEVTCPLTSTPSIDVTKRCERQILQPGDLVVVFGTVTNTGNITLNNVVVTNTIGSLGNLSRRVFGPVSLAPGAGASFSDQYTAPLDSCPPYLDIFDAFGTDKCNPQRIVTDRERGECFGTNSPSIDVVKRCPTTPIQPGSVVTVTGTVTNTGNITLNNVVVMNTIAALGNLSRQVLGPISLAPGAGTSFSDSYVVPLDSCGPYVDTFAASGSDKCFGRVVTDSDQATCPGSGNPSIEVTKTCERQNLQPGDLVVVNGTVRNTGNITLNNVVVSNTIGALGNISRLVYGPATLAPGALATFSDSYTAPLDSCPPYLDIFTAYGTDKCNPQARVSNLARGECFGTNSPSIDVVKTCPTGPIQPGQLLTVTGTVTNTGNITLNNVYVTNTTAAGSTVLVGPISLAPQAGLSFSASYTVPLDSCGPYVDTFTARGADKCFGRVVTDSDTKGCQGTNAPSIQVYKTCPQGVVTPGQTLIVSGAVTNTGNITLNNVVVTNTVVVGNVSKRVFGPVTLSPGAGATFTDSYLVPVDSCGPYTDTLSASGLDKCFNQLVTSQATATCPVAPPDPRLVIRVNDCPAYPCAPDSYCAYSGSVSNAGNVTLTNVMVANNLSGTGILVAARLAPGAVANFNGWYYVPATAACSITTTVKASGYSFCGGPCLADPVTQTCPLLTRPGISVEMTCPTTNILQGGVLGYKGVVKNTGNTTLNNVLVFNNRTPGAPVFGPITLTPGDSATFYGTYNVPENCCVVSSTLTATGADVCNPQQPISDTDTEECFVMTTPRVVVTASCPTDLVVPGDPIRYSGTVSNAGNITLIQVKVTTGQGGQVLGPITLAPRESVRYTATIPVPTNSCTWSDGVVVKYKDACHPSDERTESITTAECRVIGTPRIAVAKVCPTAPTPKGGVFIYTGWVKNTGNVTLTNVTVVNSEPTDNTAVIAPITTLAPGAMVWFTNSYTAPMCCCFMIDTLTATGWSQCASNVSVTATATEVCPLATTPGISLTENCPRDIVPIGGLFVFSGTVANTGDVTLDNVYVRSSNTVVLGPITLGVGESQSYVGSFVVTTCGPRINNCVTAEGEDTCTDRKVTAGPICCPVPRPVCEGSEVEALVIGGNGAPAPAFENGVFSLSFMSKVGANYTVQYMDSLDGSDWSDLEAVVGTGDVLTVTDATGKDARFYRVVSDR